jgi:hypothetical protein
MAGWSMSNGSDGGRVVLWAAIIGAVAVIIAAVINILPNVLDGPTPQPTAVVTATAGQSAGPTPTETVEPSETIASPTPPTPPPALTFLERVAGDWTLGSWTEAGGPVVLGIDVLNGTMTITGPGGAEAGTASWRMDIQESGEPTTPQPAILCGGQTSISGMIEGVPGGGTNAEINWTGDLQSINRSTTGEDLITMALCGWATIGTRAPFTVTLDGQPSQVATQMEMTNDRGTFRWLRP